ncbi:MAG: hypothetical protein II451_02590 [Oscillospiraceae bacterium]|nr:hypothetical protein [Oscillospiraceae bacterium]
MSISASGPSDFAHGGKGKTIFDPIFLFLAREKWGRPAKKRTLYGNADLSLRLVFWNRKKEKR